MTKKHFKKLPVLVRLLINVLVNLAHNRICKKNRYRTGTVIKLPKSYRNQEITNNSFKGATPEKRLVSQKADMTKVAKRLSDPSWYLPHTWCRAPPTARPHPDRQPLLSSAIHDPFNKEKNSSMLLLLKLQLEFFCFYIGAPGRTYTGTYD